MIGEEIKARALVWSSALFSWMPVLSARPLQSNVTEQSIIMPNSTHFTLICEAPVS